MKERKVMPIHLKKEEVGNDCIGPGGALGGRGKRDCHVRSGGVYEKSTKTNAKGQERRGGQPRRGGGGNELVHKPKPPEGAIRFLKCSAVRRPGLDETVPRPLGVGAGGSHK